MTKKSDHKHQYEYYLVHREHPSEWFNLRKRCVLCGFEKVPSFGEIVYKTSDGYYRWCITLEDFTSVHGELPIREE